MFLFFKIILILKIGDKVDLIIKMNENFPHSNKLVLKKNMKILYVEIGKTSKNNFLIAKDDYYLFTKQSIILI